MKRIVGVLLMALLLAPSPAGADELTLRDVIELHRTGLGDDLLIAVIDADGGPFSLSFGEIQDLKSDGLSERVIAALVRTGSRGTMSAAPVVQVSQEVVTYAPTVVIVGATPAPAPPRGPHSTRDGQRNRHETANPAAATWVTRQRDGRNITAAGPVRSSSPPATWVTPRDPTPGDARETREAPRQARPTPR